MRNENEIENEIETDAAAGAAASAAASRETTVKTVVKPGAAAEAAAPAAASVSISFSFFILIFHFSFLIFIFHFNFDFLIYFCHRWFYINLASSTKRREFIESQLKEIAEKVRDALEGGAPLADAKELMRSLKEAILTAPTNDSSRPDAS